MINKNILQSIVKFVLIICVIGAAILTAVIFKESNFSSISSYFGIQNGSKSSKPENISTPKPTKSFNQPVVEYPQNGYTEKSTESNKIASLKIITPSGSDYYYILLKSASSNKTEITVFVHPGETVETKVPLGNYKMYYATGKTWYGKTYLFGPDTVYSKADDVFDFYIDGNSVMGHTVTLIKQLGGNLSISDSSAHDFAN